MHAGSLVELLMGVDGLANTTRSRLSLDVVQEIAEIKFPDLNAVDLDAASRIVEGTARNMGITVEA
jgi:large subunit ribosomal protein L11